MGKRPQKDGQICVSDLCQDDARKIRQMYWQDDKTLTEIAKTYPIHLDGILKITHNVFLYDADFVFPNDRNHVQRIVDQLTKGNVSLNYIVLILKKLFGGTWCVNTVRRLQKKVSSRELKLGRGN